MKILALQLKKNLARFEFRCTVPEYFFLLKVQNRLLYTLSIGRYTGAALSSGLLADRHSIKVTRANLSWDTVIVFISALHC